MVFGDTLSHRFGSNRRRADDIRVEKTSRDSCIVNFRRDSKDDGGIKVWTWAISRKDHLHVNVLRHCMERKRKYRNMWIQFTDTIRAEILRSFWECQVDRTLLRCWSCEDFFEEKFFMTLGVDLLDRLNGSCLEYFLLRTDQSSQVKGWIHWEMKNIVWRITWTLRHMPTSSCKDVGHFWDLDVRKSGVELMSVSHMGEWSNTAEVMMLNFVESRHLAFRATSALQRQSLKKQRRWKEVHSLQRKWRNRWIDSSHCYFCQSAQYLRSNRRFVQRIGSRFKKPNRRWELWPTGIPNANAISQSSTSRGFVAKLRPKIRRTSWWSEIVENIFWRWFLEGNWERTIFHYN